MRSAARWAPVLLVLAALPSAVLPLVERSRARLPPGGRDDVTLYEQRFAPLRPLLPRHGVVGYVADTQAVNIHFDPTGPSYYATQYSLAPLIVVYSTAPALVVGNFTDPAAVAPVLARLRLRPLRDFGNGVLLLRHED